jgi:hypothetical protein
MSVATVRVSVSSNDRHAGIVTVTDKSGIVAVRNYFALNAKNVLSTIEWNPQGVNAQLAITA